MRVAELDDARRAVLDALGVDHPAHGAPTRPAIERYTGVLYQALDAASLAPEARRRLHRNLLTVSGLWGLVAPRDPIPHYKLKLSAALPPLGRLSTWWRPQLTAALAPRARGATVWDLLPIEHAAAVAWAELAPRRRVTVRFLDAQGRAVSHWNKLLKGSLVRWLVETGVTDPDDVAQFDHPLGYRLDPAATTIDADHLTIALRAND